MTEPFRLDQSGTTLGTIEKHELFIRCACGHQAELPIADLLKVASRSQKLGDVVKKLSCRRCGKTQIQDMKIFYRGGSPTAIRGTNARAPQSS